MNAVEKNHIFFCLIFVVSGGYFGIYFLGFTANA